MVPGLRGSTRIRLFSAVLALATLGSVVTVSSPAAAHNVGTPETMYSDDAYLAQRVVEVSDTADVTLGVEWSPTVDGFVTHITFCLDAPVNSRIPVWATLWTADGTQLGGAGGGSEGFAGYFTAPCFWHAQLPQPVDVFAGQRYVVAWHDAGGQYSYVPHGFDNDITNTAAGGHLIFYSNANSTVGAGNGLYVYTGLRGLFPTESWEGSDYLISPEFTPYGH
jgi:hypothetical protein